MMAPILVTTATNPPEGVPYLKMTSSSVRKITAKAAVFLFAAQGAKQIVIADATASTLLNSDDLSLLGRMGTEVEQVSYQQEDDLIRQRGKGFGEGQLMRFALQTSSLLRRHEHFFKVTGKVYCRNFLDICKMIELHKIAQIFWRWMGDGTSLQSWADARFYYTSRDFAENHLISAYLKSIDSTTAAEFHLFNLVNEKLRPGRALRPLLSGFAGGTGEQYFDAGLGALDIAFPCWLEREWN